jgi:hypothetical protein
LQAEASFLDRTVAPPTYAVLARVSPGYPPLPGRLPTCYSPVRRSPEAEASFAHDLHVLSTPPAFILSQDQTLQFRSFVPPGRANHPAGFLFGIRFPLRWHPKGHREPGSRPLTSLFLYLVFKEPTPRSRLAPLRANLVSEGRRSIGQAGPGVNPFAAPPRFVVRRDLQPFARGAYSGLPAGPQGNRGHFAVKSTAPPLSRCVREGYNPSRERSIPPGSLFVNHPG